MEASVLIITFNEAKNLRRCLASLQWCDDILVVDSGSTDETLDVAASHGARILHHPFENFARQRNLGLDGGEFRNEWVLHLDADEVVTDEFVARLRQLTPPCDIDAYKIPSKTMLFGKWLRYAGMYPTYQVRLGHRDRLRFMQFGHGQREDLPPERVSIFDEPYLHYTFSHGLREWLMKHLRYAEDEARVVVACRSKNFELVSADHRRRLKQAANRLPLTVRPIARFFYIYFGCRGFLDGARGAFYALALAVYEGMIAILAWEIIMAKSLETEAEHLASSKESQT
jgi:glycosyltransferase involved in cell wall biosynthesis